MASCSIFVIIWVSVFLAPYLWFNALRGTWENVIKYGWINLAYG